MQSKGGVGGGARVSVVKPAPAKVAPAKPAAPKAPTVQHHSSTVVVVGTASVHHHDSDDMSGWDALGILLVFVVLMAVGWWAIDRWLR